MIKIYEAVRQNRARLVFNYCNCNIPVEFINGNTTLGRNAQFRTNNRFVQDAIEKDARFGKSIKLKGSIREEGDVTAQSKPANSGKSGKSSGKKSSAPQSDKKEQGENAENKVFKNEADALYYLEQNFDIDVAGLEGDKLKAVLKAHDIVIEQ